MKKKIRAILALGMVLCLLVGSASASILGLDKTLESYLDFNTDVHLSYRMEVKTLMPFGEDLVEMLNGVLKNVNINASMLSSDNGTTSTIQIGVGGEEMLQMTEQEGVNGSELTTSLLKNRTLTSMGSAMHKLEGSQPDEEPFDALEAISEAQGCYKALTDAIAPFAEEKKASYRIKSIGGARWVRLAKLSEEQSTQLAPMMEAILSCGMDEKYRQSLVGMTYQKGFVVALYQAEQNGKDMAVYMKGNVTLADGSARKLAYQWAFTSDGTARKDTYKFELITAKKPTDNRVIAASYAQKLLPSRLGVTGTCEVALKGAEGSVTTTVKQELSGEEKEGVRSVTGTLTTTKKASVGSKTDTSVRVLTPKLNLTSAEGSGVLSGTVLIEEKAGKETMKSILLTFDDQPAQELTATYDSGELYSVVGDVQAMQPTQVPATISAPVSSLIQNENELDVSAAIGANDGLFEVGKAPIGLKTYTVPNSMQTIDLDKATEEQLAELMGEISQNLAGRLLIALGKLPTEDVALLHDNMSDETYAAFLQMLTGV